MTDNEKAKSLIGKILLKKGTESRPPAVVFVEELINAPNFNTGYYLTCRELNIGAVYWLTIDDLEPFDYAKYISLREEWEFKHALKRLDVLRHRIEFRKEINQEKLR